MRYPVYHAHKPVLLHKWLCFKFVTNHKKYSIVKLTLAFHVSFASTRLQSSHIWWLTIYSTTKDCWRIVPAITSPWMVNFTCKKIKFEMPKTNELRLKKSKTHQMATAVLSTLHMLNIFLIAKSIYLIIFENSIKLQLIFFLVFHLFSKKKTKTKYPTCLDLF